MGVRRRRAWKGHTSTRGYLTVITVVAGCLPQNNAASGDDLQVSIGVGGQVVRG